MNLDVDGLNEVSYKLKKLDSHIKDKFLAKFADDLAERADKYVDTHTITGALRLSTNIRKFGKSYSLESGGSLAPYAKFVHFGSSRGYKGDPYLIRAVNDELPLFNNWLKGAIDGI